MKHIIFLSTLLYPLDYQERIRNGEWINPSHQQYMSRLAEAFAQKSEVSVLSLPPIKKRTKKKIIPQNIHPRHPLSFFQFSYWNLPIIRSLSLQFHVQQFIRHWLRHHTESLILVIDINSRLAGVIAKRWRRHPRMVTIGVATDDPRQLSASKPSYQQTIFRLHRRYQRYIGLTPELLKLFNPKDKPQICVPAIVEASAGAARHPRPYFFFSGALYPRYGIAEMIEGFLNVKQKDFDLIIAGYGPEASLIERLMQQHRQIKFLGMLTPQETSKYQAGAYANLNPRPLDANLDAVSIPSKVFDYMSTGVPLLTTEHPFLKAEFPETCLWISESSATGIRVAIERMLAGDYSLFQAQAIRGKTEVFKRFGIENIAQALTDFIKVIN
jgi:glycosyltransferase involved in cell wall biosynthesis